MTTKAKGPTKTKKKTKTGKYHEWLTEDGQTKIEGWARQGLDDEQISKNMGIHVRTLYEWQNKYPQIKQSLKVGKEVVDFEVENKLLKRAKGYEYEELKTIATKDASGKETIRKEKTMKTVIPDVTAIIFWLKNRDPINWRNNPTEQDRKEQEVRIEKLETEIAKLKAEAEQLTNPEADKPIEINLISRGGPNGSPTDK